VDAGDATRDQDAQLVSAKGFEEIQNNRKGVDKIVLGNN
jgi:hypothetical protein